MFSENWSIGGP